MNSKRVVPSRQVSTSAYGSNLKRGLLDRTQLAVRHLIIQVQLISILALMAGCGGSSSMTSAPTPTPSPTPTPTPTPTVSYGHFRTLKSTATQTAASRIRPNDNTPTSTMTYPRVYATATLLNDGRVLVAGGDNGVVGMDNPTGPWAYSAEIFDPATETFSLLNSTMSAARVNHCAVTLSNGGVVMIGGWAEYVGWNSPEVLPSTVDLFDPGTNSFVSYPISGPLPNIAGDNPPACFLLSGDRIFINSDYSGPMVLDTNTWTTHEIQVAGVPTGYKPVNSSAAQTPDGRVWIVGGQVSFLDNSTISDVMRFDPADESASIVGHLIQARFFAGVLPFPDNSIEVYGGVFSDVTGLTTISLTSVERITSAGTAIKIGDLPMPKFTFTPVMLQNGKSLQVGGSDLNGLVIDTQFVFDETSYASGVTGNMVEKRRWYGITPLNTGRVLIVGGETETEGLEPPDHGSNTAEIFEPDANLYVLIPKTTVAPGEFVQLSTETSLSGTVTWTAKYGTVTAAGGYTAPSADPNGQIDQTTIIQDEVTATLPTGEKAVAPIRIVFPAPSAP